MRHDAQRRLPCVADVELLQLSKARNDSCIVVVHHNALQSEGLEGGQLTQTGGDNAARHGCVRHIQLPQPKRETDSIMNHYCVENFRPNIGSAQVMYEKGPQLQHKISWKLGSNQ